jgi:hypothetical protein
VKFIKLFENFGAEYPFSITVEPTEEFKRSLLDIKNSEGKPTYLLGNEFRLVRNMQDEYNLVRIATTPFELTRNELDGKMLIGKEDDYWLSYDPKNSEIYVHTSRIFGSEFNFDRDRELISTDRRYAVSEDFRRVGLLWIGGYYCKFENGFEVGMVDHRGYFRITKLEPFS